MTFKYTEEQSINALILVMKTDGALELTLEDATRMWKRMKGNRKSRSWLFDRYEEITENKPT